MYDIKKQTNKQNHEIIRDKFMHYILNRIERFSIVYNHVSVAVVDIRMIVELVVAAAVNTDRLDTDLKGGKVFRRNK